MDLRLNGFTVEFSDDTFTACVQEFPHPKALRALRNEVGDEWFSHWRGGLLYSIPRVAAPTRSLGEPKRLKRSNHDHLHVLRARIEDLLPELFRAYNPFSRRPFTIIAQKEEFVGKITKGWSNLPELVQAFEIRPRFELEPRIIELHDGATEIALILAVRTKWFIRAPLTELSDAGVELAGLHVIRRKPRDGQRRHVGRIAAIEGGRVVLSESYDDTKAIPCADAWLEGSRSSFSRCLSHLLGSRFAKFENLRDTHQADFLNGPGCKRVLETMGDLLGRANSLQLADDLTCKIGTQIALANSGQFRTIVQIAPTKYCFDSARTKTSPYAWSGLEKFGPFDKESFPRRTPRILVVCPDKIVGQVGQKLRLFRDGIIAEGGSVFEKGLAGTFHLVNPEFKTLQVPMLHHGAAEPAVAYRRAIEEHLARDSAYDAAVTVILDTHARLPDKSNPYLHSKAVLLGNGIPVQEVRNSTLSSGTGALQYIFQNFAIALYAKLGGIPWTVDHGLTVDDEIVIGMGAVELSGSRFEERQRHIGITTVFRGDGNYLLSNLSKECSFEEYPTILRDTTVDVLQDVKRRNAWRPGDTIRVVFHAYKPLKKIEVAEIVRSCVEEVGAEQTIEFAFLTVSLDHPFKLLDLAFSGRQNRRTRKPQAVHVPNRGIMVHLGRFTRLLCTNGPTLIKRGTSPLPSPVLIHLHPESTYRDLTYLTDQALKFTSLSWRSTLPCERPVTIYYSELIAELLARLRNVPSWSPMVLNTKLRTSKWFL